MEKKRIYLSSPTMHGEEQKFVQEAFDTNWVAPLGPNVNELEKEVASYAGCKSAAALSAGTAAIHLALKLAGIKEGDVILAVDGLDVDTLCELRTVLFSKNIGERMLIKIFRENQEVEVVVTVE